MSGQNDCPMPSTRWGPAVPPAKIEPLGLHDDAEEARVPLAQVTHDADERARRAAADHGRVDAPLELLPDLGTGRVVVRLGVRGVRELLGHEAAGDFRGELEGLSNGAGHSLLRGGGDDRAAEGRHELLLLDGVLLGHARITLYPLWAPTRA